MGSLERDILATRMTTTIGKMQEFDPTSDRISTYLERAEMFFQANEIAENKRVAVLLSIIGGKTYSLLSDLLAPEKPASKSFAVATVRNSEEALRTEASDYRGEVSVSSQKPYC